MPRGAKSAVTDKQKRQARLEKGQEQKGTAPSEAGGRTWAAPNTLHGGGNKFASRRKLPSGPLGGSGRKTNSARSS